MNRVEEIAVGVNKASDRRTWSCVRVKGRPWPKGVVSNCAHRLVRFGTIKTTRP